MLSKEFISSNGWFEMKLPSSWEEYESDDEGTYAFFNANEWTGNLRITPYRNTGTPNEGMATKYLETQFKNHEKAKKLTLGTFDVVTYKDDISQDGEHLVVYYWVIGQQNNLLVCSFTINKEMDLTEKNLNELKLVEEILSSIQVK